MRPRGRRGRRRAQPPMPNMIDTERYERLREVLDDLMELNMRVPVLVEGKRDEAALRELGLTGEIIMIHSGQGVHELCEEIVSRHRSVVLLMDWDTTGEKLNEKLSMQMQGHWEEHADFRRLLKVLCQKEIKDMEGIPGLIRRLKANAIARPEG